MPSRRTLAADLAIAAGPVLIVASFLPWYGLDPQFLPTGNGTSDVTVWEAVAPGWWVPVLAGVVLAGLWFLVRVGAVRARWLPAVTVAVGVLGVVLVLAEWWRGLAVLPSGDFGWYAYAPLPEAPAELSNGPRIGFALGLAALVLQTGAAGLALRRREA